MTDEERVEACAAELHAACLQSGAWVSGDGRIYEDTAAQLLGIKPETLANRRYQGAAPPHYKHGRITYRIHDLAAHIEAGRAD